MADAAFLKAQHLKNPQQYAEYLALATAWHALAQDLESDIRSLEQLEASQERVRQERLRQEGLCQEGLRKSASREKDRDLY